MRQMPRHARRAIALTHDNKTLLKAGGGIFYDRVPLNISHISTPP